MSGILEPDPPLFFNISRISGNLFRIKTYHRLIVVTRFLPCISNPREYGFRIFIREFGKNYLSDQEIAELYETPEVSGHFELIREEAELPW